MNTKPSKRKSERTRPMMQMMMLSRSANQRTPTHPTGLHHPSRNRDEDGRRKFYSLMILTENKEKKKKKLEANASTKEQSSSTTIAQRVQTENRRNANPGPLQVSPYTKI